MLVRSVVMPGTDDPVDIVVNGGTIAAILPAGEGRAQDREVVDGDRRLVVPAFIDSHVHLLYLPEAAAMGAGGIAAAVDLAAPMRFFETDFGDIRVIGTGPMVTARGGYPTQSWGAGGYGLECADAGEAVAAVEALAAAGAVAIKLPITGEPVLDEDALRAAASRAHELGLRVASHALRSAEALLAAEVGVDVLAHTPVETLSEEAISAWADRAVISTLRAFGGSETAVDNLRRLRAAGAVVLYGTDFGNTRTAGIDPDELSLLRSAGLDSGAILTAATSAPAAFWGLDGLGSLDVGDDASFLLLSDDPFADPTAFASGEVVLRGVRR
jgi:imidazolonepropionase-like amidohydrolase